MPCPHFFFFKDKITIVSFKFYRWLHLTKPWCEFGSINFPVLTGNMCILYWRQIHCVAKNDFWTPDCPASTSKVLGSQALGLCGAEHQTQDFKKTGTLSPELYPINLLGVFWGFPPLHLEYLDVKAIFVALYNKK